MSTRTRLRSGKVSRWLLVLIALVVVFVVLILLAPMLVMGWVRGYVRQETFRGKMEQFFGTQLQGSATLAPLRWTGDEVTATEAGATTAGGWRADLDGLRLALDWNAFRQRKWRIIGAGADSLLVERTSTLVPTVPAPPAPETKIPSPESSSVPAWLRSYLPATTEVDSIHIDRFTLSHPGPWLLKDARLRIAAWQQGETSLQASLEGGIIETPVSLPVQPLPLKFNLTRATARLSRDDLHLTEATLQWLGSSEITARGHIRPAQGTWNLSTHLAAIPLRECLSDDWKLRLTGILQGDLEIKGTHQTQPTFEGDIRLREGILTALPILDRLATYTGVERFKRLVLDIASTHLRSSGEDRHFEKIILQSNGLLRIEGTLHIQQGQLDGSFLVGVTPETLKWIPGAQQHVFTSTNPNGPPGMFWTPLRITGSVDAPREDLSDRLLSGAGKALLSAPGEIASKGTELLLSPLVGKDAAAKPSEVLKGTTDAAGKAMETGVKTGVKLLEGFGSGLLGR